MARLLGEKHPMARFLESDIEKMHELFRAGSSRKEIAAKFDVHRNHIASILRGSSWPHLRRDVAGITEPLEERAIA
jgi:hypothetical protein